MSSVVEEVGRYTHWFVYSGYLPKCVQSFCDNGGSGRPCLHSIKAAPHVNYQTNAPTSQRAVRTSVLIVFVWKSARPIAERRSFVCLQFFFVNEDFNTYWICNSVLYIRWCSDYSIYEFVTVRNSPINYITKLAQHNHRIPPIQCNPIRFRLVLFPTHMK